jgi:predicted dehydrogenase
MTIDALKAGKHVLCEKTMAYGVADGQAMVAAARSAGRVLQIGHQRRYNERYHDAVRMVRCGLIGDVYHIRAMWHRNGDWRRPVPDVAFDPRPWGYADLERLVNWRLYRKHSQGLMAELGSHQVDVANWISGAVPTAVIGSGGIYRYQDGREVNDHVYATFEYPGGLTVTYTSIQSNQLDDYYEQIMGTTGTIILQGEGEAYLFMEGGATSKATEVSVTTHDGGAPVMEASASRAADAAGAAVGEGVGAASAAARMQPYHNELEGFVNSVRTGTPPLCGGAEGLAAASAVLSANEAITGRKRITLTDLNQA